MSTDDRNSSQPGSPSLDEFFSRNGHTASGKRSSFALSLLRISRLIRKEFLQLVRNKQNFRILVIAPFFQLLLFGHAVRLDVQEVHTVVADLDRSPMSRSIVDAFTHSGYFIIDRYLSSYDEADYYLLSGRASAAILIPPDLERKIKDFQTAEVAVLIDGVDTIRAGTISGYAERILQRFSTETLQPRIGWARGLRNETGSEDLVMPSVEGVPRAWFNPNLDSKDYFVPGVIVLVITFLSLTVTAMAIVREKERGTIEQLMVTPITSLELVLGKTIPSFIIAAANLTVMTFIALAWFDPPFRGSMVFFFATGFVFIITCLAMGMTISVFCRTQQQAMLSSFMVLQPAVLLSGFAFPIENMPLVIQYVTYLNPLRYYLIVVREVFLKGMGWETLWPQILPIVAMAAGYIALSSVLFKQRID
jgi:ABC-2 type transport system permease protein